jgi:hypothetical protein
VKAHVAEIKKDIERLKFESTDLKAQNKKRQENITMFQGKLQKIREGALFLGDITQYHERAIKHKEHQNRNRETDQKFLENMILRERVARKKLKEAITKETMEQDLLFAQALEFMEKCPDVDKKRELLAMMSEDKRKQLLQALERKKTKAVKNEPVKAIEHKRTKYENIKISNFV